MELAKFSHLDFFYHQTLYGCIDTLKAIPLNLQYKTILCLCFITLDKEHKSFSFSREIDFKPKIICFYIFPQRKYPNGQWRNTSIFGCSRRPLRGAEIFSPWSWRITLRTSKGWNGTDSCSVTNGLFGLS